MTYIEEIRFLERCSLGTAMQRSISHDSSIHDPSVCLSVLAQLPRRLQMDAFINSTRMTPVVRRLLNWHRSVFDSSPVIYERPALNLAS